MMKDTCLGSQKYNLNGIHRGASLGMQVLGKFRANVQNALLAGRGARAVACSRFSNLRNRAEAPSQHKTKHTTLMKTLILALIAILILRLQPVLAASPDEEARFVAAAKQAFEKHDADALVLLTCWDHVPDRIKQAGKQQYARAVMATNVVITLASPDAQIVKLNDEWKKNRDSRFVELDHTWQEFGVTNRLNLPASKEQIGRAHV